MIRIEELSVITFMGKDAATFLHNQLTADIKTLSPGESTFAALCQPKGRVMALLLVQRVEDGFRVVCHDSLAEKLATYLLRFRFREKVDIAVAQDLAVVALNPTDDAQGSLQPIDGVALAILPAGSTPVVQPEAAAQVKADHLQRGVVWLDEVTTEQFLPQMLGQDTIGALNFRKGCFPGQEVIARTRYLGKLKRHPWTGRVKGDVSTDLMEPANLHNGDLSASGVLVARAQHADGSEQVFVVARRPEAFEVATLQTEQTEFTAQGEWLTPPVDELAD